MRTLAGLLALHALILATGVAALLAAGVVRARPRELILSAGLAHLAGVAATFLAATLLLILGASLTAPVFAIAALALAAALLAFAGLRARRDEAPADDERAPAPGRGPGVLGIAFGALIAFFIAVQAIRSRDLPTAWDAAHNWTLKAITLFYDPTLGSGAFRDAGTFGGAHQAYPILDPAFAGTLFRFVGKVNQGLLAAELWLLLGAMVAAAAFFLRDRPAAMPLFLAPLGIAVASGPAAGVVRGDADPMVAAFLATGALCLGLWLERPRRGLLPIAILLLAASANVKNEGIVFSLAIVVAALVVTARARPRSLPVLAAGAGFLVLALVPWRIWVSAHGPFPSDVRSLGDITPALLADHLHALDFGARAVIAHLADGSGSGWLVPAFLVFACALVARGRVPHVAFYLAALFGMVGVLLLVYWTSPQPNVEAHIERTSLRTVTAPLFLVAVALAHMLSRLDPGAIWRRDPQSPQIAGSGGRARGEPGGS
jgi:hypothetical protein